MYSMNAPQEFPGTDEERQANRETHDFYTYVYSEDDFETRCTGCDCRPSGRVVDWPCGQEPPRVQLENPAPYIAALSAVH